MNHADKRKQEILDGKRSWNVGDCGGDYDVFYTEFVSPLRALKAQGMFDGLLEEETGIVGEVRVWVLEIVGSINYERPRTED